MPIVVVAIAVIVIVAAFFLWRALAGPGPGSVPTGPSSPAEFQRYYQPTPPGGGR